MVAYSFQPRFIEPIQSDRKLQTIRATGARRHAHPGEDLQLYTGMRTRNCRLIGRRRCLSVDPIVVSLHEERIFVGAACVLGDHSQMEHALIWPDGRPIPMREASVETIAVRDGFADWKEMREFWSIEHSDAFRTQRLWYGLLIRWLPYDLVTLDNATHCLLEPELRRLGLE